MEKRVHFYVSRKNVLTWLMALCLVCSAVTRIVIFGMKGTGDSLQVWSQIILPVAAALLYVLIVFISGKEQFYKTAIPFWMMAAYFGAAISQNYEFGKMVIALYWAVLLFFALAYTRITTGQVRFAILLVPLLLSPIFTIFYLHRDAVLTFQLSAWFAAGAVIPDVLMMFGILILVFALRVHPHGEYHPTWGDRSDGRRIRTQAPMDRVSPYIMVERNASSNLFAESFEISNLERYIRQKRREGMTNFGMMHILMAAYCRGIAKYPCLNRFLSGQKVYTHGEDIQFCMAIKKEMSTDGAETVIKVHLSPRDTIEDVYNKMNKEVENVKNTPLDSNFDNVAGLFTLIPGLFLKFFVWLLKTLDYFGMLPKFLLEVSPFHGSVFFTSMGSLGIQPIYHHLYDFGNLPVFCSFGCKRRALEVQEDGSIVQRKYIDCKFTLDERIVDGFYYATFFKYFKRLIAHPEVLELPPDEVLKDID